METLTIAYATDENYAKLVWCSLKSLLENNANFFTVKAYIISDNLSNSSKDKLSNLISSYNGKICFIEFDSIAYGLDNACTFQNGKTSYARLFLAQIVKENKILYLDCDTLINHSLCDLWNTDLEGYYIAGVKDIIAPQLKQDIQLLPTDIYINAGILLINIQEWKKNKIESQFIVYIKKMNGKISCHDQGIINHVCKNKIKTISCTYNVMTPFFYLSSLQIKEIFELKDYYNDIEIKEAISHPHILHFTAGWHIRVWYSNSKHPYAYLFKKYYNLSPWKKTPLPLGHLTLKIKVLRNIFKILPFSIYLKILRIKRERAK